MSIPTCHECGYQFSVGEQAWVSDWNVVDEDGTRVEFRYYCELCTT